MKVLINKIGQVLKISDSHLVANASFIKQEYITFVIQGLNEQERERLKVGFLSVVRQDGFSINDLIMGREVDEETGDLIFSHKVLDSSQIFAVAGQIQVSLQAKGLRKEFELLGLSETEANYENYCTLASCTVVGYVQRNNGTEEEYDLVGSKINGAVANLQMTVADSQNKADTAIALAKNATKGKAYESYKDMVEAINKMDNKELFVGLPIFIAQKSVDVWVYEVKDTFVNYTYTSDDDFLLFLNWSGVQVGWYLLLPQESKIDWSEIDTVIQSIPETSINDLFDKER